MKNRIDCQLSAIFGWDELSRISRQWSYETISLLDHVPAMTRKELGRILAELQSPTFDGSRFKELLSTDSMNLSEGLDRLATTMASRYKNSIYAQIEAFGEADLAVANSTWLSAVEAFEKMAAFAPTLPSPSRASLFCELHAVIVEFKDSDKQASKALVESFRFLTI